MKAMIYERYGAPDVFELREMAKPTPKPNQVLIRIEATTVTSADRRARSLDVPAGLGLIARLMFGFSKPKQPILGTEIAGVVEAVGAEVRNFQVGDHVFAFPGISMGGYAEYICMAESGPVAVTPVTLRNDEAAALSFGAITALDFLKRGGLKRGERVLVNGASGAVGCAVVQLAKHFGAEVTGVCSSVNVELVRSLGADHVIDYTKTDFTQNGRSYDVIVDTVGTAPYSRIKGSLTERGRLLLVFSGLSGMLMAPLVAMTSQRRVIAGTSSGRGEDLRLIANLVESGEFKPVIDRSYPFEQIPEAHRYVDTGRKRGNVVVTLS